MENSNKQPTADSQNPTQAGDSSRTSEVTIFWLSSWVCLLVTVFFAASTLNCLLQWLPFAHPWDLGGTIFSGLLTWLAYAWTLSDKSTIPLEKRGTVAIGLWVFWAIAFPAVLWSLGFK